MLRRNIWSALGFALFEFCQILVALLLLTTGGLGQLNLLAAASILTATLIATLFLLAARSLARVDHKRGRPLFWVALSILCTVPWVFLRAFSIPSASMEKTLLLGDRIIVQIRPKPHIARGDIIVFSNPRRPEEELIKRVVGLPGDRLRIIHKSLYRDGSPVIEPYVIHIFDDEDAYRDNFPGPPSPQAFAEAVNMLATNVANGELLIPTGKYFVLGDNRDNPMDSRYIGLIDAGAVRGKPLLVYASVEQPVTLELNQPAPGRVRWDRIFHLVR